MSFISATPNGHEDVALVLETESPVPALQSTPARRPSEQERREFLESDKQIEKVEKHRVLCCACQAWVDLGQTSAYATGSWVKHKIRCSDMWVPSHSFPVLQSYVIFSSIAHSGRAIAWHRRNEGSSLSTIRRPSALALKMSNVHFVVLASSLRGRVITS